MARKTFPFDDQFDFGYRPSSYWPDLPTETTVLSKIKGTARRDIASRALEGEELVRLGDDELYRDAMEFVLQEGLDEEDRRRWGSVHPSMMGGEFLPDPGEGGVEIARIELESTTGDVIQVLAQPSSTGAKRPRIRYRVVDEYWDEGSRYDVSPNSTARPLSLGQLVDLIDSTRRVGSHSFSNERYDVGLIDGLREANLEEGQEEESLRDFFRVTSAFYPQLAAYYEARSDHWFQKILLGRLDDEVDSALRMRERRDRDRASPSDEDDVAWGLFDEGRLKEAERFALKARDTEDTYLVLAAIARKRGDDEAALTFFEKWGK